MNGANTVNLMTVEQRAKQVRRYEQHCYQVCYYMLRCETMALEAALASVEALLKDHSFYMREDRDQLEVVKKTAIRCSLKRAAAAV